MLRLLLNTRLQGLFHTMFGRYARKAGGKGRRFKMNKIGFAALAVFIVAYLGFSFGMMFHSTAGALGAAGLEWLYFATAGIMALGLCFIGSVFITQSQLFMSNDNDMLLSMPIRPSYILASRILTLLVLNYIYTWVIMGPAIGAFIIANGARVSYIVSCAIATLFLPLVSMALTCVLGWVIAVISSRIPKSNLITTVLFIAGFALYFSLATQLQKYMRHLIENGADIALALKRAMPPIYYFGSAAAGESLVNLLIFALMCVIPFAAVYVLLSRFFITIVTTQRGNIRVKYKERAMKAAGVGSALVRKEAQRFFGTPIYLLNCGMGAVLHLLLAGAIVIKGPNFVAAIIGLPVDMVSIMPGILCTCLAFCSMTVATSAASISLEGKSLWVLKSAPVSARQALNAKLLFNMAVGGPTGLLASIAAVIVVPMGALDRLIIILFPVLTLFFTALLGLFCNLMFPRFDWISEATVVKQSMSVLITMLGGMALVMGAAVGYVFLSDRISMTNYVLIWALVLGAACAVLFACLRTKGEKIYESL